MIQPLKLNSNINFKANAQAPKEQKSFSQRCGEVKKTATGVIKKINSVVGVGTGAATGVVQGAATAGVIGILGKNIKNASGHIGGTLKGIICDFWNAVKVVPKTIKSVWLNSPKENLKNLFKETIPTGARKLAGGLKKHGATAAIAACAGIAVFTIKTVQGKIDANSKNANLDHATKQGHI